MEGLKEFFERIFREDKPVKLIFSAKRRKSLSYSKVTVRPIALSGEVAYQAEYIFDNKVTHTNVDAAVTPDFCVNLMEKDFKQANVFTADHDIQVLAAKQKSLELLRKRLLQIISVFPVLFPITEKKTT